MEHWGIGLEEVNTINLLVTADSKAILKFLKAILVTFELESLKLNTQ